MIYTEWLQEKHFILSIPTHAMSNYINTGYIKI